MAITKYDNYYSQLIEDLKEIEQEHGFTGNGASSKALGFWYMEKEFQLDPTTINEHIIDGDGDRGIDAYYLDEDTHTLNLFQFKLPKPGNFKKEIDENAISKIYRTITNLFSGKMTVTTQSNPGIRNLNEVVNNSTIYKTNVIFVAYNKGIQSQANIISIKDSENSINEDIDFQHNIIDREKIINIFDRSHRNHSLDLKFEYKNLQSSNSVGFDNESESPEISSWVGMISAKNLINGIDDNLSTIFDENIRLYENGSKVNIGIKETAKNEESATMFYFYNNGVTIICDEARNSPGNNEINLLGASIVNGAQTVNSLAELDSEGLLQESVNILIRIIQIQDYEQRAKITEYLNSQTAIKESYFIANHSLVRKLQEDLFKYKYYLERQINEYAYKSKYQKSMSMYKNYHILPVENAIQRYVGGYLNNKASQAKSNKSTLFDSKNIEENMRDISAKKVVISDILYDKISSVITMYRKNRRNVNNNEFSTFLGIEPSEYNSDLYSFVNTGDILILNTVINIQKNNSKLDIEADLEKKQDQKINECIKEAINLIKNIISNDDELKSSAPATLTKATKVFNLVQEKTKK